EYMMSKVIGSWVNIKNQNSITFTNLSQGIYTLKIRGTNNDGKWGSNIATLRIRIKPAWYESPIAIISYIILILSFVLFLRKNTIRRVELEQAIEMEKLEKSKSIELNEAKIKFFTNISHEFRTPLTLILAPIKNLHERYGSDSGISDYLGIIDKNAKRLHRLVNQVLDFRKVSNDTLTLHPAEKNICNSVTTVVSYFDLIADQRNIELTLDCSKEEILVFYDEDKLEKTLFNLISNAFSAIKEKGKIEIGIRKELAATEINFENFTLIGDLNEYLLNNGYVEISIIDTGSGLPPGSQEKIFEKFYQGESVSTGAGIGLYLVKTFTLYHKGIILFRSDKDQGTTFKIRYPLGDNHFTREQLKAGVSDPSDKLFNSYETERESEEAETVISDDKGARYNLLIVEDDMQMGQYLASELREYDVVHTIDAESALTSTNENLPDLIISDILLPGINGLEFCTSIKENLLTSHIPVILLSARAMDNQILEGLETGADSYLTKPFNIDILRATIKNLINSKEKLRSGILHISGFDFKDTNISSVDEVFLNKLKTLIEDNLDNSEYNVEMLSLDMGMSRTHLFRKMKSLTGQTYITFIKTLRLQKAARLLKTGKLNISEIAFSVGFSDPKYFSKTFKQEFGVSPSDYQSDNL
ncbi:MAG: hybrid sensor histidine kinase/response regulator transcription factor, partial [Bacteroidales bacterium]|nr:hybrid sensor histidine kinase/response regulator transcription factor [Bacteroidales bacterium]